MDRLKQFLCNLGKKQELPSLKPLRPNLRPLPKPPMEAAKRPMKYPYTFAAKIAQFPYKFHINNVWFFKYYIFGVALTLPVFYKIGKMSYAPENVKKWEEIRRKEFTPHVGHH